jgi:hypothetical protein
MTQVKRRALPVLQKVGVFRRLFAVVPGLIPHLDPAEPLDPHVAFPAGHDKADRIALLGAQPLAVHMRGDKAVIQRLFQRDRPGHGGGIRAFGKDPGGIRPNPRFFQQKPQRHAGIDDVVDHPMGELAAVQLRPAPFHARIRRAFEEIGPVLPREAHDVFHREHQRRVHQPVDHQPVLPRVDLGDAGMVAFETQPVGRDDPLHLVQRREVDELTLSAVSQGTLRRTTWASYCDGIP